MHYIPNEDKDNSYEVVNCKYCPLFKTKSIDNTCYIGYCDYTEGDIIYYDKESNKITLSGKNKCQVKLIAGDEYNLEGGYKLNSNMNLYKYKYIISKRR